MVLERNCQGEALGVYSVCSANRFVLEAAMLQARSDGSSLLIESTSSQVNQFGGYTGQTPTQFVAFVSELAAGMKFPAENIVFGGDHLGPYVWSSEPAASAMAKAEDLVRACVLAGYTKIHLDASMALADDGARGSPPPDEVITSRAADLCKAAEQAYAELPSGSPPPLYVIGTEVPVPGGELLGARAPETTRVEDLARTLELTRECFLKRGLDAAWDRVIAVVVQPGVEFGDTVVFPYTAEKTRALSQFVKENWHGVFEAHSTDYQSLPALAQMVKDHFAILKVGPWLTFAFREAIFGLANIEEEWNKGTKGFATSRVRDILDEAMLADPRYWRNYYHGNEAELHFARKYSLSDRSRYYWPNPNVDAAVRVLLENLSSHPAPLALLSQYLPDQASAVQARAIAADPVSLIRHKIQQVLKLYAAACDGMKVQA